LAPKLRPIETAEDLGIVVQSKPYETRKPRFRKANARITHTLVDFEKIMAAQHVSTAQWRTAHLCRGDHTGEEG